VHPAATVRHCRRLTRPAPSRPGSASWAQMHGESTLHGVDPPNSRDPHPRGRRRRHPRARSPAKWRRAHRGPRIEIGAVGSWEGLLRPWFCPLWMQHAVRLEDSKRRRVLHRHGVATICPCVASSTPSQGGFTLIRRPGASWGVKVTPPYTGSISSSTSASRSTAFRVPYP
jgi:hypothetical protein